MKQEKYDKNWVSKTILYLMTATWLMLCLLSIAFWKNTIIAVSLASLSLVVVCIFCYFAYAHYKLSTSGRNVPGRISDLLIEKISLNGRGRLLDIGCGSGIFSKDVIKETLRVLKKDGIFVFQDILKIKKLYGRTDELISNVKNLGVEELHWEDTSKSRFISPLLRNNIFFGGVTLM
ncbi:MAG: hypothetical protein LBG19_11695 [Prevotellaceae bacterium]|jgi:SAM-dependent methyltransferase|nr:hypothetical protein [Prevotellaceae bacterium]